MDHDPLLRAQDLAVDLGGRRVLADVDLTVAPGTSVAVIGPNGSGKSTLLHAVIGLVDPSAGTVECDRSRCGIVLQETDVDASLPITVAETVRMGRYARRGLLRRFGHEDRAAVAAALDRVEVTDLADRPLHDLSAGQRRRVLVAQGLAQEADLLLLDEPVSGLDMASKALVLDIIDAEKALGRSVIMTTHDLADAAACDLVLLLAGRAVACGPPREVIADDHLRAAFGGRMRRLEDGEILLDDPHHAH